MGESRELRYSQSIDYLVPSILYLGTNREWWARSARGMAKELSLKEERLLEIFNGFPAIFRKSHIKDRKTKQHYYALQARYAKRLGTDMGEKEKAIDVLPLPTDHLKLVLDFVLQMAEAERAGHRTWIANAVSVGAATVAALAAITAAGIKVMMP